MTANTVIKFDILTYLSNNKSTEKYEKYSRTSNDSWEKQLQYSRRKWVEVSISWPQLQTGFTQSWQFCLNLWSAKWLNPSLILVRNFNPSLLSTLNTWLGSGLVNFSITLLKKLQEAELRILTSRLFHSSITAGKKEFLKKFVFVLRKRILLFWTLLVVLGVLFSRISWNR